MSNNRIVFKSWYQKPNAFRRFSSSKCCARNARELAAHEIAVLLTLGVIS